MQRKVRRLSRLMLTIYERALYFHRRLRRSGFRRKLLRTRISYACLTSTCTNPCRQRYATHCHPVGSAVIWTVSLMGLRIHLAQVRYMYEWGTKNTEAQWFTKIDDDSYARVRACCDIHQLQYIGAHTDGALSSDWRGAVVIINMAHLSARRIGRWNHWKRG